MSEKIDIDPITRIEGHLAVSIEVSEAAVSEAYCRGEMFRGFETILKGRDPLDAQQITQRICGVCPISHGLASVLAQDQAYGVMPPANGRLLRNLILGANYIQSHIIHFYHLAAMDFIDVTAISQYNGKDPQLLEFKSWVLAQQSAGGQFPAAPFLPRYDGLYMQDAQANITAIQHYLKGLRMRALAQKMAAVFAGKMPHAAAIVPGGVSERVTAQKIAAYSAMLHELQQFIDTCYLPDVLAVAGAFPDYLNIGKGCGNYMAYGVFQDNADANSMFLPSGVLINGRSADLDIERITEDVGYSFYRSASGLAPWSGQTEPAPDKAKAYSWLKAPRYQGMVMEVGPLARVMIAVSKNKDSALAQIVGRVGYQLGIGPESLDSTMGRHAARAIECKYVADQCAQWVSQLKPDEPTFTDFLIPSRARGVGLTEAPRGALGHWLEIEGYKISRYQCVVPTTWNCSPRDDKGNPGAVEQALVGTPVVDGLHPIEAARVVRAFDPCIACAVH